MFIFLVSKKAFICSNWQIMLCFQQECRCGQNFSLFSIKFGYFGLVAISINIWVYFCIPIFCEYWQVK
jgi:hypothetical protein